MPYWDEYGPPSLAALPRWRTDTGGGVALLPGSGTLPAVRKLAAGAAGTNQKARTMVEAACDAAGAHERRSVGRTSRWQR